MSGQLANVVAFATACKSALEQIETVQEKLLVIVDVRLKNRVERLIKERNGIVFGITLVLAYFITG
jgi:hypothetical protein